MSINKDYKICVCLDGGGCRGVIESTILDVLSNRYQLTQEDVDLIVGTSTGTIVGTLYRANVAPKNITGLYLREVSKVFEPNYWSCFGLFGPKYKSWKIKELLHDWRKRNILPYPLFSSYPKLMLSTFNLSLNKEDFLKSWKCNINTISGVVKAASDLRIIDVLRATTAAPTYFSPVFIHTWFCDGGVVANCPLLAAYTEMRKLYGDDQKICIISIGTGRSVDPAYHSANYKKFGALRWLERLLNVFVNNSYDRYIADRLTRTMDPNCTIIRLNPLIPKYLNKMVLNEDGDMLELIHLTKMYMDQPKIDQLIKTIL